MNTVSLKTIGDWRQKVAVPLRDALAVSVDVFGRTGQEACKHAIILMAQSAKNMTPKAPARRKAISDPKQYGAKYIETWKQGATHPIRLYKYRADQMGADVWESAKKIGNSGLARRSWMWALRGLGQQSDDSKAIPGVSTLTRINGKNVVGYIVRNALSYVTRIMPAGWEARVAAMATNRIMAQAARRMEQQIKRELSGARRAGTGIGMNLARYFLRAA